MLGISDAIGRSRPIFAIEDRDFRTIDEARDDCERNRKDRESRAVKIISWSAWNRCEIENYLLEPAVLLPVFRTAFSCSDDDIIEALNEILPALALFQASQYAVARARRTWLLTDPTTVLLSSLRSRPEWKDKGIVQPDHDAFRDGLEKNCGKWTKKVQEIQCDAVADFDAKFDLWKGCQWRDDFCRSDWAGKEILHWLRVAMTSRFGWPNAESGQREALDWTMNREKREAQDRPIETALRPRLVDQFLSALPTLAADIQEEFEKMKAAIKDYRL
jgi:hypothetical protein